MPTNIHDALIGIAVYILVLIIIFLGFWFIGHWEDLK